MRSAALLVEYAAAPAAGRIPDADSIRYPRGCVALVSLGHGGGSDTLLVESNGNFNA